VLRHRLWCKTRLFLKLFSTMLGSFLTSVIMYLFSSSLTLTLYFTRNFLTWLKLRFLCFWDVWVLTINIRVHVHIMICIHIHIFFSVSCKFIKIIIGQLILFILILIITCYTFLWILLRYFNLRMATFTNYWWASITNIVKFLYILILMQFRVINFVITLIILT